MTRDEILEELQALGSESTKKTLLKHGAREPFYGVKVEDLKKLQKKIKTNPPLALQLYDTGISDAMYLAGLITDGSQMTKEQINQWAEKAYWYMLSEYTVALIAAENPHGYELALEWIQSSKEHMASAGWATLAIIVSIRNDRELDLPKLQSLLQEIKQTIHTASNRVRYTMNGFVIASGAYVPSLTALAEKVATEIGKIRVDMGGTACKVPYAPEYIQKVKEKGIIGKKRKLVK